MQAISTLYFGLSSLLQQLYITAYLLEIKHQFKLLEFEIQKALNFKDNDKTERCLIDCVKHHQELLE